MEESIAGFDKGGMIRTHLGVVIACDCAEGEGIGVIDDHEIGGEGWGVKGGAEGL